MNDVQQNAEMQLDAADPVTAAGYREDGMYDAVTSCTNSKSKRYATSYYTENTENGSIQEFLRTCGSIGLKFIYGASCIIKNVDVEN